MERLTQRFANGQVGVSGCGNNCKHEYKYCRNRAENCPTFEELYEKLAAYEDTGLTPQEIMDGNMLTGWIPVEEKLPEYDGLYLVCLDDGYISSVEYMTGRNGKRDWDLWSDSGEVIAWMPLPEVKFKT